jgi:hypothetical protein
MMKKLITLVAVLGVIAFLGCEQLTKTINEAAKQADDSVKDTQAHYEDKSQTEAAKPAADDKTEAVRKEEPKPAPKTTGKEEFEGYYIEVWVDGQKTKNSGRKEEGELVWTVDACSSTPTVRFTLDKGHLGDLKATDVVINPVKDGKADPTDLWHPEKARSMKAGTDTKLDAFDHIAGGKLVKATRLPAGEYRLKMQVNGTKTWDRQSIRVTIK